ncbi:MAG: AraC family transcriptional regulator [Balneolaceae bacterium]|nr:MAG: AraC family transcriptional regulator [Balneolaceae bacterium]
MNTVFIIGIFLCFFLQFLLMSKKEASTTDKILAVWMFVFGLHLFSYYLHYLGYWEVYPHLSGLHHPFPLLHGPFLYLYVLFSIRSDQRFNWQNYLHFAPAALFYIYMIPFLFFYSAERKLMVNRGLVDDYAVFIQFSLVAFIISGISYTTLSYRLLGKYRDLTEQNFAYRESIDLNWLRTFIWGLGLTFIIVTVVILLDNGLGLDFGFNTDLIFFVLLIAFILYLGYSGIRHRNIFSDHPGMEHRIVEPRPAGEYNRSGLKAEDADRIHKELLELMKTGKPYLEPKLTLSMLADELKLSPNHLSQVINQYEEKNFFDFVNAYRIEEFKKRALDPLNSNYSILAIALDSGFNSKSSFNQVFKKVTGKTPSRFMTESAERVV